jgi:hypothetical protein
MLVYKSISDPNAPDVFFMHVAVLRKCKVHFRDAVCSIRVNVTRCESIAYSGGLARIERRNQ